MKKIIKLFLTWRILLFIPIIIGIMFVPFRKESLYTTIWEYTTKYPIVENNLVYPWSNFDGVHYLAIASRGYKNEGRFLPLFPFTIAMVAKLFSIFNPITAYGTTTFWAGIFVSTVATVTALYYLFKLIELDYKDDTAKLTLLLLLTSPTAFFLACIYSEGLFLLLSVLTLYLARKKRWLLASLVAMLLSITRLSGLLIVLPLLVEFYELEVKNMKNLKLSKLLELKWFFIIPLPLLAYSYFNLLKWQDPLYFVHAHSMLGNSRETTKLVFPLVTLYRYLKIVFTVSPKLYEYWIAVLELGALIYATSNLFLNWKEKLRPSYQIFALAMISLPLLSGTLSGFPRYILPIFPFFLSQALLLKKIKRKIITPLYLITATILQAILLILFSRGFYIS